MKVLNLLLALIFFCSISLTAQNNETVNIMTYNIKGHSMTDSRLKKIAQVINSEKPDLVALQEVDNRLYGMKHNHISDLAAATGMKYKFFALVGTYYGIGILYKDEPISSGTKRIVRGTNSTDKEDRGFVYAEFNDFVFMSTHYSLNAEDRDVATDWAIDFALNSDKTVFIAGDFNAKPTYRAMVTFKNNGFVILNKTDEYTYPADAPDSCIDMLISYSNFREAAKYEVLDSYIANSSGLDLKSVSDHLPVVVKLHRRSASVDEVEENSVIVKAVEGGFMLKGLSGTAFASVYDTLGRCVKRLEAENGHTIAVNDNKSKQLYLVKVQTTNKTYTFKLIF